MSEQDTFDCDLGVLCQNYLLNGTEGTKEERAEIIAGMLSHLAADYARQAHERPVWPKTPAGLRLGIAEELTQLAANWTEDADAFRQELV